MQEKKLLSEIDRIREIISHGRPGVISEQNYQDPQFRAAMDAALRNYQRPAADNTRVYRPPVFPIQQAPQAAQPSSPIADVKDIVKPALAAAVTKVATPTAPKAPLPPPAELKDTKGVQDFQNWLDKKYPGWATGYRGGILAQGKNGGGYGRFGPRTSKAWASYKNQYLSKDEDPFADYDVSQSQTTTSTPTGVEPDDIQPSTGTPAPAASAPSAPAPSAPAASAPAPTSTTSTTQQVVEPETPTRREVRQQRRDTRRAERQQRRAQ